MADQMFRSLCALCRRLLAISFAAIVIFISLFDSKAFAIGCHGHFVNPVSDICWSCVFPITIGPIPVWPSSRPDTDNPALPICLCGSPIPRIGLSVGFWEPVRLVDASVRPFCFVNLGGVSIDPGLGLFNDDMNSTDQHSQKASWNVHWYIYPVLYWLNLLTDFACLEAVDVDIAYITEIDPLWNSDELTFLIDPEAILFANPLALLACAADCVAATIKKPLDVLFWCAGCQGSMYPLNGNVSAQFGHVQGSRLAASRMIYKLHRMLLEWGTSGKKGLCGKYVQPIIKKSQYRLQMTNVSSSTSGRYACAPIGALSAFYEIGKMKPVIAEDYGYLVWRKRNCCAF